MVCMFVIIYQNVKFCKTFFQLILVWEHGSVRLTEEKTPEVLWNRKWTPICGHFFWDNQYGPNLFCKKLDSKFIYGKFTKRLDKLIERDSIWIGNCGSGDDWLSCLCLVQWGFKSQNYHHTLPAFFTSFNDKIASIFHFKCVCLRDPLLQALLSRKTTFTRWTAEGVK